MQRMRARELKRCSKGKSVLAIGPGISRFPETSELVRTLVSKSEVPIVLDADGLNAFEGRTNELSGKGRLLVITPHPGEMARLAGAPPPTCRKIGWAWRASSHASMN